MTPYVGRTCLVITAVKSTNVLVLVTLFKIIALLVGAILIEWEIIANSMVCVLSLFLCNCNPSSWVNLYYIILDSQNRVSFELNQFHMFDLDVITL